MATSPETPSCKSTPADKATPADEEEETTTVAMDCPTTATETLMTGIATANRAENGSGKKGPKNRSEERLSSLLEKQRLAKEKEYQRQEEEEEQRRLEDDDEGGRIKDERRAKDEEEEQRHHLEEEEEPARSEQKRQIAQEQEAEKESPERRFKKLEVVFEVMNDDSYKMIRSLCESVAKAVRDTTGNEPASVVAWTSTDDDGVLITPERKKEKESEQRNSTPAALSATKEPTRDTQAGAISVSSGEDDAPSTTTSFPSTPTCEAETSQSKTAALDATRTTTTIPTDEEACPMPDHTEATKGHPPTDSNPRANTNASYGVKKQSPKSRARAAQAGDILVSRVDTASNASQSTTTATLPATRTGTRNVLSKKSSKNRTRATLAGAVPIGGNAPSMTTSSASTLTTTTTTNPTSPVAQKGLRMNTSKNRARAVRAGAFKVSACTGAELGNEEQRSASSRGPTRPTSRGLRQHAAKLQNNNSNQSTDGASRVTPASTVPEDAADQNPQNGLASTSGRTLAGLRRAQEERQAKGAAIVGVAPIVAEEKPPGSRVASEDPASPLARHIEAIQGDPEDPSFSPPITISHHNMAGSLGIEAIQDDSKDPSTSTSSHNHSSNSMGAPILLELRRPLGFTTSAGTHTGLARTQEEREAKIKALTAGVSPDMAEENPSESTIAVSEDPIEGEITMQEIQPIVRHIENIQYDPEGLSFVSQQPSSHHSVSDSSKAPTMNSTFEQFSPAAGGDNSVCSNATLVVARVVNDVDDASLMQAEEVDPENLENKAIERKKDKDCVVAGLAMIAISLAVLFGAIFGLSSKDEKDLAPTAAPSMAPSNSPSESPSSFSSSSGALDLLQEGLPEYTKASLEIFGTPQWKARDWLQNHPELPTMEEINKLQLFSLATFYYSMAGGNWPHLIQDDWLVPSKSECNWFSDEFGDLNDGLWEESSTYNTTPCNEQKEFQLLLLGRMGLTSHKVFIPPEISLLTSLSILALPLNDINASLADFLPSQLYQISNLKVLNLLANSLGGSIPSEVGKMTAMEDLGLGRNALTGTIPSEVGRMTAMEDLSISKNDLSGPLPSELGLMTNMTSLWLYRNNIGGTIPSEVGRMTAMEDLGLHRNILKGPLPSELGLMTSMTELWLHRNSLNGTVPSEVGRMTSMVDLSAYENALTGPLPSELGLMTDMAYLWLFRNSLSGTIPSEVGRMASMVDISIRDNSLSGPLPSELGLTTSTTKLYLYSNSLTGTIPSELGKITSLKQLRLDSNALSGTIPLELESLAVNGLLSELALENNSFSGTIPESLCSLGMFDSSLELGLSFDCNEQLCGCCWCPCPGSKFSTECMTHTLIRDDNEWPGAFPFPANRTNAITINIRTDDAPEETSFEWSAQDESGLWNILVSNFTDDANSLHSYTIGVASDSIYSLKLFDSHGDGTCCAYGYGWFTNTNSIPSSDHKEGTVVWEATGDVFELSLEVFIWIDQNGTAQLVEYIPREGYALLNDDDLVTQEQYVIVVPARINSSIGEIMDEAFQTSSFVPSRDDKEWPGIFPVPANKSNVITINIRTDGNPEESSFEWSVQDVSGQFRVLATRGPPDGNSLQSYTIGVASNSIYRLKIFDRHGDGTCCEHGYGWFTITNSFPSGNYKEGTVIWEATGHILELAMEVFIWVDQNGKPRLVEYIPEEGYALLNEDELVTEEEYAIVAPERMNSSSGEILDQSLAP